MDDHKFSASDLATVANLGKFLEKDGVTSAHVQGTEHSAPNQPTVIQVIESEVKAIEDGAAKLVGIDISSKGPSIDASRRGGRGR